MTDTYLRSLGFTPTEPATRRSQPTFRQAWRYQHDQLAADGAALFIEHPLGIAVCRLSTLAAPLRAADVFASVGLHDRPALAAALAAFFTAHGGQGLPRSPLVPSIFRPFRRRP